VIEQARAAARQAALSRRRQGQGQKAKKAGTSLFAGFGAKGSEKKAKKGGMKTALMVSATAAFTWASARPGCHELGSTATGPLPERVAQGTATSRPARSAPPRSTPARPAPAPPWP
jgi:localization factor PodJL